MKSQFFVSTQVDAWPKAPKPPLQWSERTRTYRFMNRSLPTSLLASLALYTALTLALLLTIPRSGVNAPDEGAHRDYIQTIVATHALPIFAGQSPPALGYEFHQPPLFYLLASPLWAVFRNSAGVVAVRCLSLSFGLLTILVIHRTARLLWGEHSRAPTVCALLAALSPLHQGVGASINNDALAGLWAACLFYLVARAWLIGAAPSVIVWTGIVAGLGTLTKLTTLPLGLWALVCLALALRQAGRRPLSAITPALGAALLLVSPMLLRNQILYGDPLAYRMFSHAAGDVSPGIALFSQIIGADGYLRGMALQIIATAFGFWGGSSSVAHTLGTFSSSGPRFPSPFWTIPFALVVLVPLFALGSVYRAPREKDANPNARALASCWTIGALLVALLWLQFALAHVAGGQARYLHAALLPVTVLLGGGLSRSKWGLVAAGVLGVLMIGMTLANILVWKTLV